jgi:hypothetical protein
MNFFSSRNSKKTFSDVGSALAMVLIYVVIFSLVMGSIAILIISSNATIESSKEQNLLRANLVYGVIPQALATLSQNGVRYGMDPTPSCSTVLDGKLFSIQVPATSGKPASTYSVIVECTQAPKSGTNQPIASFALTGGARYIPITYPNNADPVPQPAANLVGFQNESTSGQIGQDGGLKLDPSLSGSPLVVTGGLVNVSGAWFVPADTIKMKKNCITPITSTPATLGSGTYTGSTKILSFAATDTIKTWRVGNKVSISGSSDPTFNISLQDIIKIDSSASPPTFSVSVDLGSGGKNATGGLATAQICPNETDSQISQPSNLNSELVNCPAYQKYKLGDLSVSPCSCPNSVQTELCPTGVNGLKFSTLDPQSLASDLGAYIDSISGALEDVPSSTPATITGTCASPISVTTDGKTYKAFQMTPGYVDSTLLSTLNTYLQSGCLGDGNSKPLFQFLPGIFRFNLSPPGTASSTQNTIRISGTSTNNPTIIGGSLKTTSEWSAGVPKWECNDSSASAKGVQFQFQNASYFYLDKGFVSLCPLVKDTTQPILAAPSRTDNVANTGNPAPFYWLGKRESPILENSQGAASSCVVCMDIKGQVFTPAGFIRLNLNGESYLTFKKGIIARALTISGTGSAKSGGEVAPPLPFNGDRVIQLRLKATKVNNLTINRDLGIVQIVIRDYYGRRIGSGYKIISWRTAW